MSTRRVGEILKAARLNNKLTLKGVQKKTKIRVKHLSNIEKSQWDKLPGRAYTVGFVKSYADAVELDSEKILAMFRREYDKKTSLSVLPESYAKALRKKENIFLTIKQYLSKIFILL